MYREIDEALARESAEAVRVECAACRLRWKPSTPRCSCGYDLTRELERPEARFRSEVRRSARPFFVVAAACACLSVAWFLGADRLGTMPAGLSASFAIVFALFAVGFAVQGLRRRAPPPS